MRHGTGGGAIGSGDFVEILSAKVSINPVFRARYAIFFVTLPLERPDFGHLSCAHVVYSASHHRSDVDILRGVGCDSLHTHAPRTASCALDCGFNCGRCGDWSARRALAQSRRQF